MRRDGGRCGRLDVRGDDYGERADSFQFACLRWRGAARDVGLGQVKVWDGSDDGVIESPSDNTVLAVQGVFVP
jgi:hypothetical protein